MGFAEVVAEGQAQHIEARIRCIHTGIGRVLVSKQSAGSLLPVQVCAESDVGCKVEIATKGPTTVR